LIDIVSTPDPVFVAFGSAVWQPATSNPDEIAIMLNDMFFSFISTLYRPIREAIHREVFRAKLGNYG
jgi:hypothetical protein